MKEDRRMKDISKAVPGGTMPYVGPKQNLKAAPGTSPAQTLQKESAAKETPKTSPEKTVSGVSPEKAADVLSSKTVSDLPSMQAMPGTLPAQTVQDKMAAQSAEGGAPANKMPVQPGPYGVMPVMQQIPIICCPYLMNLQCPMIYGANLMGMNAMNGAMPFGAGPAADDMMPYTGGGSVPSITGGPMAGIPGSNMYPPYGMGALPSAGSQYFPMSGMDY